MPDLLVALKHSFAYQTYRKIVQRLERARWESAGCPSPPPHLVRAEVILTAQSSYGFQILIEAGTAKGDMVHSLRTVFRELFTIDDSAEAYRSAQRIFSPDAHVHCFEGDSGKILKQVLSRISEPCLFWLDNHQIRFSGRAFGGERVLTELQAIAEHPVKAHGVLISHARLFVGKNGYPDLASLRSRCHALGFEYFDVEHDIIHIFCAPPPEEEPAR